jgi:poly(A) polymerase
MRLRGRPSRRRGVEGLHTGARQAFKPFAERIWKELKLLLAARDPGRALLWMRQTGVLTAVLPETEKWGIDSIPGLIATETALDWDVDPMLRLMAIVPPDPTGCARLRRG